MELSQFHPQSGSVCSHVGIVDGRSGWIVGEVGSGGLDCLCFVLLSGGGWKSQRQRESLSTGHAPPQVPPLWP